MSNQVQKIITDRILQQLQQGVIPWRKPWNERGEAKNLISKKTYQGINQLLLSCSKFSSPYWLTFNQIKQLGGQLRGGEKSSIAVFWKLIDGVDRFSGEPKKIPFMRYYKIFNADQVAGIEKYLPKETKLNFEPIEACENFLKQCKALPPFVSGDKASYSPRFDILTLPPKEKFHSVNAYYATLFHELIHSTGHKAKLNRIKAASELQKESYKETYSKEELVAEIGASILCALCGIDNNAIAINSAAYIQNWIAILQNDTRLIIQAASQAQKAINFLTGKKESGAKNDL